MPHNPSPQVNDPADGGQPLAEDARLLASLQALYGAPEPPAALRRSGAEQIRLEFTARQRAGHGLFGAPRPVKARHASAHGHPHAPSRQVTIGALAAVALISLLAAALFARPGLFTTTPGATSSHSPRKPAPPTVISARTFALTSVAMVSASDGWAFGWSSDGGCLVLHYDGATWTRRTNSTCGTDDMVSVFMLSATDGWAVGGETILRYSQGEWRVDTVYAPANESATLQRIAMVSPTEGWAVGSLSGSDGDHALILHYAQGHWTPATLAGMDMVGAAGLRGIAMISSREGWAVGSQLTTNGENALVLHYFNGRWTRLDWTMVGSFNGVAAFPSGDIWVVGEVNAASGPGLVVHLHNGAVVQQDRPVPGLLHDIVMLSPTEGWAVGDGAATVRYHNGVWTRQGLTIHQFALMQVALVSPTEGWAVGSTLVENNGVPGSNATLFHLTDSVWGIYPLSSV